jgi:hypothetical protein
MYIYIYIFIFVCVFFFFFAVLAFELRAYTLGHFSNTFFVMGFLFGIGSWELFAQAGFKPQFSSFLPLE